MIPTTVSNPGAWTKNPVSKKFTTLFTTTTRYTWYQRILFGKLFHIFDHIWVHNIKNFEIITDNFKWITTEIIRVFWPFLFPSPYFRITVVISIVPWCSLPKSFPFLCCKFSLYPTMYWKLKTVWIFITRWNIAFIAHQQFSRFTECFTKNQWSPRICNTEECVLVQFCVFRMNP